MARHGLPFVDRERDVIRLSSDQINNAIRYRLGGQQQNPKDFVLNLGAQMTGCGKTYLAESVHLRAQSSKETRQEIEKQLLNGFIAEDFDRFVGAKFLRLDLRTDLRQAGSFEFALKLALLQKLLLATGNTDDDRAHFALQSTKQTSTGNMVEYFAGKYGCAFFVHVDQIDFVASSRDLYVDLPSGTGDVELFAQLWSLLQPIVTSGGYMYCSGRSSTLYLLGAGFHSIRNLFQGQCVWYEHERHNNYCIHTHY